VAILRIGFDHLFFDCGSFWIGVPSYIEVWKIRRYHNISVMVKEDDG
jgi:hypothetical protein